MDQETFSKPMSSKYPLVKAVRAAKDRVAAAQAELDAFYGNDWVNQQCLVMDLEDAKDNLQAALDMLLSREEKIMDELGFSGTRVPK